MPSYETGNPYKVISETAWNESGFWRAAIFVTEEESFILDTNRKVHDLMKIPKTNAGGRAENTSRISIHVNGGGRIKICRPDNYIVLPARRKNPCT
jgi:hypothetical protein